MNPNPMRETDKVAENIKKTYMPKTYHFTHTAVFSPAYGRQYTSARSAIADLKLGYDWQDAGSGQYTSIRDCAPGCIVELRYGLTLEKFACYTVTQHDADHPMVPPAKRK